MSERHRPLNEPLSHGPVWRQGKQASPLCHTKAIVLTVQSHEACSLYLALALGAGLHLAYSDVIHSGKQAHYNAVSPKWNFSHSSSAV